LKTYILEPTADDLKNLIQKGTKEIMSSLRVAHPKALTTKELIELTGIAEATVYASITSLKKGNYIKEVKFGPGRPQGNEIDSRTTKYVIEDGNHSVSKKYQYKLSRGNVEYDPDFIRVSDKLLEKVNLDSFFDNLLSVAGDIQSLMKDEGDKDFKKWAPLWDKENVCPNCKINHEVRDFLRAMLLRLLDKFETDERYDGILTRTKFICGRKIGTRGLGGLNETLIKKSAPKDVQKKSLIVRILSIKKDASHGQYYLLAIDKHKNYVCVDIDISLVSGEILLDTMVECLTDYGYVDPLGILNLELSKKDNDTIKRIDDLNTFPKTRDVIRDIGSIVYGKREEGEISSIEGIIIQRKRQKSDNNSSDEFVSSVLLRDNTGMIPLKLDSRLSNKFLEGDKILVVGAQVNQFLSLTAGRYCSISKTGNIIITDRNSPYQNSVYSKHLEINSKVTERKITIRLIDIILTYSETRIFLSIENEGENDLHITPRVNDFIAFQNKKQFIARDIYFKEKYFPPIPPRIAENLTVRFEEVNPTEPIVSFRFKLWPGTAMENIRYFTFTVQIPR